MDVFKINDDDDDDDAPLMTMMMMMAVMVMMMMVYYDDGAQTILISWFPYLFIIGSIDSSFNTSQANISFNHEFQLNHTGNASMNIYTSLLRTSPSDEFFRCVELWRYYHIKWSLFIEIEDDDDDDLLIGNYLKEKVIEGGEWIRLYMYGSRTMTAEEVSRF